MNEPQPNLSDSHLIQRVREGDLEAFNILYHRYSSDLYTYAFKIIKEQQESMDAVQDVFVWLWENRANLEIQQVKPYLMAAVKYKLLRVIHNSARKLELIESSLPMDESVEDTSLEVREIQEIIEKAIQALPVRAREIYQLSRNELLSNKEIAQRLGISEKTVENQMTISLRKLRGSLGRLSFWVFFL